MSAEGMRKLPREREIVHIIFGGAVVLGIELRDSCILGDGFAMECAPGNALGFPVLNVGI